MTDHVIIQVRDEIVSRLKGGLSQLNNRVMRAGDVKLGELDVSDLPLVYVEVGDDTAQIVGINGGSTSQPQVLEDLHARFTIYCVVQQDGDAEQAAFAIRADIESTLLGTNSDRSLGGKVVNLTRTNAYNNRDDGVEQLAYVVTLEWDAWIRHLDRNPTSFTI